MKRVLVTGAGGFVGANLVRRLVAEGHKVSVIIKTTTKLWRVLDVLKDVAVYHSDLLGDALYDEVIPLVIKPDIIYHLATHGGSSWQTDAEKIFQTNIVDTWKLLKVAKERNVELFVNVGSSSEYGFKFHAMRETDLLEPNSFYSATKGSQSLLCQQFANEGLPLVTLRLFSVYGPYEDPNRLISSTIAKCLSGKDLELSSPETARDFVYVDDVVDAFLEIEKLRDWAKGQILNVGTGVQTTIGEVVQDVVNLTNANVKCSWGAFLAKKWDSGSWVADISKINRLIGWKPKTNIVQGLIKTIEWTRGFSGEK